MNRIRVKIVDFPNCNSEWDCLQPYLDKASENIGKIEYSNDPDFLICGPYGYEHSMYNCTKIAYIRENVRVNFEFYDYGIGFDNVCFEDRYLPLPWYLGPRVESLTNDVLYKHEFDEDILNDKDCFCNFVVSNKNDANPIRKEIFERLSDYKRVESGGRLYNNQPDGQRVKDKRKFQEKSKFSIAFENSSTNGYSTEKIMDAFAAHTVPIYWGDPKISEIYNENAFINCNNFKSIDEVIKRVIEIDNNDDLYKHMLYTQAFNDSEMIKKELSEEYFVSFFRHVFSQGPDKSKRVNNFYISKNLKEDLKLLYRIKNNRFYRRYRKIKRMMK